jgi:DNA-directed RNA polymerase subunit RPC12/RpoP
MRIENLVSDKAPDSHEEKQESEKASKEMVMKAILIKRGKYLLSNSFVLPSYEVCLLGEAGTVLIPQPNVLPIIGIGNKDIKCSKCGYVLALNVKRLQIRSLAIRCPSCGYMNRY